MKKTFFKSILIAAVMALCMPAFATKPSDPKPPSTSAQGGTGLGVGLGVGVGLGGAGGDGGAGIGVGGSGIGYGGGGTGDVAVEGDSGHMFVMPAPVTTIVPQSSGGIVTKSHSVGLVWNFVSWSKSEQMTDPFQGAMRLINEYEMLCQFETAAIIRQRQYALLDPSYRELPAQPGVRNMTPDECAKLRK